MNKEIVLQNEVTLFTNNIESIYDIKKEYLNLKNGTKLPRYKFCINTNRTSYTVEFVYPDIDNTSVIFIHENGVLDEKLKEKIEELRNYLISFISYNVEHPKGRRRIKINKLVELNEIYNPKFHSRLEYEKNIIKPLYISEIVNENI